MLTQIIQYSALQFSTFTHIHPSQVKNLSDQLILVDKKDNEIGSLRESNMNFFLKLSQQEQTSSEPEEIKATPQTELKSWDEFLEEL